MLSNDDLAMSMVVVEHAVGVVASDNNNGDMQAAVHFVAKSKRKRQKHQFPWEYLKDWQEGDSAKHCGKCQCTVASPCARLVAFVVLLTNGYEPPSTRTILRRIVELYRILEPLLAAFLCSLDVAISLTLDDWPNRNLKGFYVVIAHWVDIASLTNKSILPTVLDIKCGTGVSKCIRAALFEYLKHPGRDVVTRLLNVISDNGLDMTAAVARLI
ncbi:unnamed protein product [Sphagnum balticum]